MQVRELSGLNVNVPKAGKFRSNKISKQQGVRSIGGIRCEEDSNAALTNNPLDELDQQYADVHASENAAAVEWKEKANAAYRKGAEPAGWQDFSKRGEAAGWR